MAVGQRRSGYAAHCGVLWRASRAWAVAAAATSVVTAAATAGTLWAVGRLIGSLGGAVADAHGSTPVWAWFAAVAGLLVISQLLGGFGQIAQAQVSARYHRYVLDLGAETMMAVPGPEWLEDTESATRVRLLLDEVRHWLFRTGVDSTWQVLSIRLTGAGALAIACSWRWWAPLVVAVAFLAVGYGYGRWVQTLYVAEGSDVMLAHGRAGYLRSVSSGAAAAKELRLFGLSDFFVGRFRDASRAVVRLTADSRRGSARPVFAASAFVVLVLGGALVLLARDGRTGLIGLGAAMAVAQALVALSAFGPADDAQTGLTKVAATLVQLAVVRRELGLPELSPAVPATVERKSAPRQPAKAARVEFSDVEFTYPARNEPTLRGMSLTIPAGQSVAIVGANGAGKSTAMKLLAGLYTPQRGSVRIDGVEASTATADRRVAIILQDFVRYPLTLRDNVGFGALDRLTDQPVLDDVLERAGGTALLQRLEHGWDTVLSNEFAGGTDLSGGQWQRVALARALAAVEGGAGVLVLDEPTAALDVRAEAALFERFLSVTRGVTTVLVSHRLSSVRRADRIVVLDAGTGAIVEDGTHEELLAEDGTYARMFRLQASRFAAAGSTGPATEAELDAAGEEPSADGGAV